MKKWLLVLTVIPAVSMALVTQARNTPPPSAPPPANSGHATRHGPPSSTHTVSVKPAQTGGRSQNLVQMEQNADQWVMPAGNYSSTRFSKLKQINRDNVKNLQVAWEFSDGALHGHEGQPLVVGDVMYLIGPYPDDVFALDLKHQGAILWEFQPYPASAAQGMACCDVVNRGVAYSDGRIFFNTLDDRTIALDATTGKKIWETKLGKVSDGMTMTMAPLVVGDHVLVGNSGGEEGVRGWLKSLDAKTGKVQWTADSTGPDKDVLIGKDFDPYYQNLKGKNLGETTWPNKFAWEHGTGAVWGWISYDPKQNLIYYGTSNPGPWNGYQRPGRNLWTAAMFARNPDTGQAKWAYQFSPHDMHDYDGVNSLVLFDIKIDGKLRHVVAQANRNGYMYVIDRDTGQVISAAPFMSAENVITKVDLKTGMPDYNPSKVPGFDKSTDDICPAQIGAEDEQPMAYSPVTQLLYIPRAYLCNDEAQYKVSYIAGTPYVGTKQTDFAGPGGWEGGLQAWNPATGKPMWMDREPWPVWSGVLTTDGGLVFYGTLDRWFKAVDAKTGKLLWKFRLGSGTVGDPMTFKVDGRQYVAIWDGVGGAMGIMPGQSKYGGQGGTNVVQNLGKYTAQGGALYVFALPQAQASGAAQASVAPQAQAQVSK